MALSDCERSSSRSLIFQGLIFQKRVELVLLLNTSRKSYVGSPAAPSYFTSSELEIKFKFQVIHCQIVQYFNLK